ncbi:hypothetical protein AVEN_167037-1 [Araneus ventricosus]|uniref:Uncharacterized protein n=1 Tax=Araneus ventricosus TaxID=182803 RepID=A0A4Y2SJU5_ARAVE|nr:hypothetical protein AVEN_167037-1 [Araneus ventricosus]
MYEVDYSKGHRELYPYDFRTRKFEYKTNIDGVQIYAKDNDIPYYATFINNFGDTFEYYAKNADDEEYTNKIRYIKKGPSEIYPIKIIGGKTLELYDKNLGYAKDIDNNEYYATNTNSDEYVPQYLKTYAKKGNVEFYPKTRNKKQTYIKDSHNKDILITKPTGGQIYAMNSDKTHCIYPKTSTREEFYAKDENGKEYYGYTFEYPSMNNFFP